MTILQSRLSGMYFKSFGVWVAQATEALPFDSQETAKQFIAAERLADVAVRETEEVTSPECRPRIIHLEEETRCAA